MIHLQFNLTVFPIIMIFLIVIRPLEAHGLWMYSNKPCRSPPWESLSVTFSPPNGSPLTVSLSVLPLLPSGDVIVAFVCVVSVF